MELRPRYFAIALSIIGLMYGAVLLACALATAMDHREHCQPADTRPCNSAQTR